MEGEHRRRNRRVRGRKTQKGGKDPERRMWEKWGRESGNEAEKRGDTGR